MSARAWVAPVRLSARRWIPPAAIALAALAATAPLLLQGPSCGHDFDFHLLSWIEVARDWREGMLAPHWLAAANYGAGEPRLLFYPPLSWVLGAALTLVFGANAAPALFTGLTLLACGLAMRRLAAAWLPSGAATVAGCLYVVNPYTLFVAYERTAYGELLAGAFLPLLLLYAIEPQPPALALAAAFAGVWLANVPAGVIAAYALLWLALLRCLVQRSLAPAIRIGAGAAFGLGLAAIYLAPAARERGWVEATRAIDAPGMRIADNWLFAHVGDPGHQQVLATASWIAILLLAVAALAWFVCDRLIGDSFLGDRFDSDPSQRSQERTHPPQEPANAMAAGQRAVAYRKTHRVLASLLPLILFLLTPWSALLWRHAPEMRFLQFPWRWLVVAAPLAAFYTAAALSRRGGLGALALAPVLAAGSIAFTATHFFQNCDPEDTVRAELATLQSGQGFAGDDEYTPAGADNSEIQQNLPPVRVLRAPDSEIGDASQDENPPWQPDSGAEISAQIAVVEHSPERESLRVQSPVSGYAVLRLMDYPAWRVQVNGHALKRRPHRDDGLMVIPVPAGVSRIRLRWRTTADVEAGRLLSLIALLAWILLFLWAQAGAWGGRDGRRGAPN